LYLRLFISVLFHKHIYIISTCHISFSHQSFYLFQYCSTNTSTSYQPVTTPSPTNPFVPVGRRATYHTVETVAKSNNKIVKRSKLDNSNALRERPFNLKGRLWFFLKKIFWLPMLGGGYGFLFCSELFFRTTRELEYFFFVARRI
jgi:hypothetical protein